MRVRLTQSEVSLIRERLREKMRDFRERLERVLEIFWGSGLGQSFGFEVFSRSRS